MFDIFGEDCWSTHLLSSPVTCLYKDATKMQIHIRTRKITSPYMEVIKSKKWQQQFCWCQETVINGVSLLQLINMKQLIESTWQQRMDQVFSLTCTQNCTSIDKCSLKQSSCLLKRVHMQSIATAGNHSLASSHTLWLSLLASQTAAHARTRRYVYIHKTLWQSHISQTQPFRLSVKASGYIINYIWHCFLCVDLQYVPRGLSRESEVQRPPARMLNQS